eukprot:PhF_6_TR40359/c0_g1_i2/m.60061/K01052/LIPA; lysosomal acid lipase/cholesteryl ester hydrolase
MVSVLFCILASIIAATHASIDPDVYRNVTQIIAARGYPVQEHYATTQDGFILTMQRIPSNNNNATGNAGKVILFWPGLVCSSGIWVMNYDIAIPYYLADLGYDVWLANSRNRPWAIPRHAWLQPSDPRMWEWSWDDIGAFDVPATVDYILNVTKKPRITAFIGHSQGGTTGWAFLLGNATQYSQKVGIFIPLGGPFGPSNGATPSPTSNPTSLPSLICVPCKDNWPGCCAGFVGITENSTLAVDMCAITPGLCIDALCLIAGCESASNWNSSRIPVMVSQYPTMTSVQNMEHYIQPNAWGGRFDFGVVKNRQRYGTDAPP